MRVDASQVLGQGGVKIKAGTGTAAESLKEGDVVRAGVLSSDKNGTVSLKLESGQSFNAKLGTDIKLSPGDMILLEVTGKEKGLISLSFSGIETAEEDLSPGQANLIKDFSDKSLAPFANKLAGLNMPVTEESARMMRELIAQNPGLSLDEAAFLASNKLTGDESLMRAALATLAGGDKTDAMIARLLSLLGEQSTPDQPVQNASSPGTAAPVFTVNTANAAPLTDLITTLVKTFSGSFAAPGQDGTIPNAATQTIIAHSDTIMQSNAENVDENLMQAKTQGEGLVSQGSQGTAQTLQEAGSVVSQNVNNTPQEGTPASGTQTPSQTPVQGDGSVVNQNAEGTQQGGAPAPAAAGPAVSQEGAVAGGANAPETQANLNPEASQATPAQPSQTLPSMGNVVAQVLSNIPEFSGTPQSALQRFSEMLLRVAGESAETANDKETLTAQLDKLFTRIGRDDADAGARLRDAREELFARLALIEESISRAAQPARAEMLAQTQKLMDHVKLLNSIDQFIYMQLPVQLREERKTADLYVFKRKGGKKADPENVNILLAIDLEFMGHWEALINIKNKDVSIQMEVPGESEKDHFNSQTVLLHNMLDEAGFKLVSTNIKFAKEETTPLTALSAFDRYTGGQQGIIDFMI